MILKDLRVGRVIKLHEGDDPGGLLGLALTDAAPHTNAGKMSCRVVVSTSSVDRSNDVVVTRGIELADHKRLPVVLLNHNRDYPVGYAESPMGEYTVRMDGDNRLVAETYFSKSTKIGEQAFRLVEDGVLRGASIGFLPVAGKVEKSAAGGRLFKAARLCEYSHLVLPDNPEAVVIAVNKGFDRKPLCPELLNLLAPYCPERKAAVPGGWEPPAVTKSRDASGHEHAADGRFGSVPGQHGERGRPRAAGGAPVSIRQAQAAAMALGDARTEEIVGPGGLSGASPAALRRLVAEHAKHADGGDGPVSIREAQEASMKLGDVRTEEIVGPGGLSGASPAARRRLVTEAAGGGGGKRKGVGPSNTVSKAMPGMPDEDDTLNGGAGADAGADPMAPDAGGLATGDDPTAQDPAASGPAPNPLADHHSATDEGGEAMVAALWNLVKDKGIDQEKGIELMRQVFAVHHAVKHPHDGGGEMDDLDLDAEGDEEDDDFGDDEDGDVGSLDLNDDDKDKAEKAMYAEWVQKYCPTMSGVAKALVQIGTHPNTTVEKIQGAIMSKILPRMESLPEIDGVIAKALAGGVVAKAMPAIHDDLPDEVLAEAAAVLAEARATKAEIFG